MNQASPTISIGGKTIGIGRPVYVIAELSANHDQSYDKAANLVRAAAAAGADAIKLQTYTPDTITIDCDREYFRIGQGTVWDGMNLYQLYQQAYTPWDWQPQLMQLANDCGLDLFSSPFDFTAVDFLESMNVPAYKIASFELNDIPLLERVASTGKPVIASTGMATLAEIELAVSTLRGAGAPQVALLKCTSAYPALPESMNLRTMVDLAQRFNVPVGLSDHTLGHESSLLSVALGGSIIEKHLTFSRQDPGPDSGFSLEPHEFAEMVRQIRVAEKALGQVHYGGTADDLRNRAFRRSLFVVRDMVAGESFTPDNVRSIRPGYGLEPKHYRAVLGQKANQAISRGTPLSWEFVEKVV
jgi:N-acetylneuraminate synthase